MKFTSALSALALAAGLAACGPQTEAPSPDATVTETEAAEMPTVTQEPVPIEKADEASAWELTDFTPATNEIYCSFHAVNAESEPGPLLFMTEIAGVPAPGAIGLEGEPVPLKEVSKTDTEGTSTWLYANEARGLMVQLEVTEVGDGFEYKSYEGTIQVTQPESGRAVPFTGTCGV
ncbi:hypothetical protein [Hyphomonas oceanitis]|uniref:Putative lipoprotein n=1 Tax=Hyphomonas oceanitis SCH89 TaxID=1280953 RepID=A0A059GBH5_9PROT|nr:hypothetical protein [Hyphomonas oceanitis]KDA04089.1 putative lipoprotein [Hyphomonas oceanitis SCH89]